MTCSPLTQKLEASVFDITFSLPAPNYFITCAGGRCLPSVQDFSRTLFLTRPGVPERKSGIPPALATLSLTDFLKNKTIVGLKLERPLKMNLSNAIVNDLVKFKELICNAIVEQLEKPLDYDTTENVSATILDYGQLGNFDHEIKGSTSQVVFAGTFDDSKDSTHEIQFGWYGCDFKLASTRRAARKFQDSAEAGLHIAFSKIVSKTSSCHMNQKLLGPWNFHVDANWTEDKSTLQFQSETLTFYIGQQNCQTIKALVEKFESQGQKDPGFDTGIQRTVTEQVGDNLEQNYVDDLRAGAFHFVEKTEIEWSEAKPYQVIFTESPSAMTWIYPKPRTLSRLSVFPMPFVSADQLFGLHGRA